MQLLCTCGLLLLAVLFLVSISFVQTAAWSGWGCSRRDYRGCCYSRWNPKKLRPPCAPK